MRKGFLLVELLWVMALMVILTLVLDSLFLTLARDIPRTHQMLEENSYLQAVLVQMQNDIDGADSLYQTQATSEATGNSYNPIVMELADSTISYQQAEDGIVRCVLEPALPIPSDPNEPDPNQRIWPVKYGRLEWQVWMRDDAGYAVEVQTYMEYNVNSITKKRLMNSRVFFLGADPAGGAE
ncbi:MAG: hypothetical protein GY869_12625 [Planctomycetes bacterium]|nr:hypothetical protein [Planctomycetota bacterium]